MLNSTNINFGKTSQTIQFNSPCTGILQRSHQDSVFVRFQVGSEMEKQLFPSTGENPILMRSQEYYCKEPINVVVLQILLFGDNMYLVEVIDESKLQPKK